MASLNETGMGIGDFAEKLFEQEAITNPKPVKQKPPMNKQGGYVPDIEDIEVRQEDVDNVLNESFGVSIPKREESSSKKNLSEEKRALREEISETVSKLKRLLQQYESMAGVTTVGRFAPFLGGNNGPKRASTKVRRKR